MFPKFDDIMKYIEWFNYWSLLSFEATNMGDYVTNNKIYKLMNDRLLSKIEIESKDKQIKFYNQILDKYVSNYTKFKVYVQMIKLNIAPKTINNLLNDILKDSTGPFSLDVKMFIQEYKNGNIKTISDK